MAVSFGRTWRALEGDSAGPRTLGLGLAGLLLAAWLAWFLGGDVKVYEVSSQTSLEAAAAAHPIATRIEGRVRDAHLELGRRVVGSRWRPAGAPGKPRFTLSCTARC